MTHSGRKKTHPFNGVVTTRLCSVSIVVAILFFLNVPLIVESRTSNNLNYTQFPINPWASNPFGLIKGPDGDTWFIETVFSGGLRIARISSNGSITEYPLAGAIPGQIASGPDGNIWFTEGNVGLGKMTTSGVVTLVPLSTNTVSPRAITFGSDGNIWATDAYTNQILQIEINGQVIGQFPIPRVDAQGARGIVRGSDGNVWFTESSIKALGYITTSGVMNVFDVPKYVADITLGPDGNIWVTDGCLSEVGCYPGYGKVLYNGSFTDYSVSADSRSADGLAAGTDGNLWSFRGNGFGTSNLSITRISTGGQFTDFSPPLQGRYYFPFCCMVSAGGGNIWFIRRYDGYLITFNPSSAPPFAVKNYLPFVIR